jgi:hypothetical protein
VPEHERFPGLFRRLSHPRQCASIFDASNYGASVVAIVSFIVSSSVAITVKIADQRERIVCYGLASLDLTNA